MANVFRFEQGRRRPRNPFGDRIVPDSLLHDYVPLGLTFHADASPSRVIGSVSCVNRDTATYFDVSLVVTANGNVFAGDEESPDQPIRFVNTSVDAFARFIKAHADYTNETIYRCQMDGSEDFESHFLSRIGTLVAQLHEIDPDAIGDRANWWPYSVDSQLAEYHRAAQQ